MKNYYQERIRSTETRQTAGSRFAQKIARVLLCLMLSFTMILPMAAPAEVFAATGTKTTYTTSATQYMAGINIYFKGLNFIDNERLLMGPTSLKATGKLRSVKLSWTAVTNPNGIDGYIVLRRDKVGNKWRQIAFVGRNTTGYNDKAAKSRGRCYRYSVVAYKRMPDGKIMVSTPAGWAGALTTLSKKKNVYDVKISNLANVTAIMTGSCAQTTIDFASKAYSRSMRWWSSNSSIARVDATGMITGVSVGTAVISAKSHTGTVTTFTVHVTKPGTAQAMIETFKAWEGFSTVNGKHKGIIDIYNSVTPWPAGYKMRYYDAWCDATISAAAIKTGNVERIGRECGVGRHIKIFKSLGIWEEDGTIVPRPGDIIVFSWSKFRQPNNASASHIGLVVKVTGNEITTLEGNRGIGIVSSRTIPVGWGCIRGYARPKYVK